MKHVQLMLLIAAKAAVSWKQKASLLCCVRGAQCWQWHLFAALPRQSWERVGGTACHS